MQSQQLSRTSFQLTLKWPTRLVDLHHGGKVEAQAGLQRVHALQGRHHIRHALVLQHSAAQSQAEKAESLCWPQCHGATQHQAAQSCRAMPTSSTRIDPYSIQPGRPGQARPPWSKVDRRWIELQPCSQEPRTAAGGPPLKAQTPPAVDSKDCISSMLMAAAKGSSESAGLGLESLSQHANCLQACTARVLAGSTGCGSDTLQA